MAFNLRNRSFLKEIDFTPQEMRYLLQLSEALKIAKYAGTEGKQLAGKEIALIFEKTSTRTRSAFEVASLRRGRARDLSRPVRVAAGAQGVDRRHRAGAGPHVRRDRVPGQRPGRRGDPRRARRGAGVQRADRRVAPDPDAGRLPDHARVEQQALRHAFLRVRRRLPVQHGPLAADHGRDHGQRRPPGRPQGPPAAQGCGGPGAPDRRAHRRADHHHRRPGRGRPRRRLHPHRRVGVDGRAQGRLDRTRQDPHALPGQHRAHAQLRQPEGQVHALPARRSTTPTPRSAARSWSTPA